MKHKINSMNTKQMLADALIDLSSKKTFSKITVSEIVDYCNINRKTFYYHFTDIYDLLEWHLNNEISHVVSSFDPIKDVNVTTAFAVNYMNQHAYIKNFLQDALARDKITQLLYKAIYPKVCHIIQKLQHTHDHSLDADFNEFLATNLTRIIILSSFDAFEHPNEYEPEKLQQYISKIFHISTNGLL